MGANPGQCLHPRGSQAELERWGAVRRGQDCPWLWRRGESRPPSRDVRVGSRRVLRGHNSFLHTGNTVKHKTQTRKEREKAEGERQGRKSRERQGGEDRCNYRHLPSTSSPHRSHPIPPFSAAPSQCQRREGLKQGLGCFVWLCLLCLAAGKEQQSLEFLKWVYMRD